MEELLYEEDHDGDTDGTKKGHETLRQRTALYRFREAAKRVLSTRAELVIGEHLHHAPAPALVSIVGLRLQTKRISSILEKTTRSGSEMEILKDWFKNAQSDFCRLLTDDEELRENLITELCARATLKKCMTDDVIFREGDIGSTFYVVVMGVCDVYQTSHSNHEEVEGLGRVIGQVMAGGSFGELMLEGAQGVRKASVVAGSVTSEDRRQMVALMVISRTSYLQAIRNRNPQAATILAGLTDEHAAVLRDTHVFAHWPLAAIMQLGYSVRVRSVTKDAVLAREGAVDATVLLIMSGLVKESVAHDIVGRIDTALSYPMCALGLDPWAEGINVMSFDRVRPPLRATTVRAVTPVTLLEIGTAALERIMRSMGDAGHISSRILMDIVKARAGWRKLRVSFCESTLQRVPPLKRSEQMQYLHCARCGVMGHEPDAPKGSCMLDPQRVARRGVDQTLRRMENTPRAGGRRMGRRRSLGEHSVESVSVLSSSGSELEGASARPRPSTTRAAAGLDHEHHMPSLVSASEVVGTVPSRRPSTAHVSELLSTSSVPTPPATRKHVRAGRSRRRVSLSEASTRPAAGWTIPRYRRGSLNFEDALSIVNPATVSAMPGAGVESVVERVERERQQREMSLREVRRGRRASVTSSHVSEALEHVVPPSRGDLNHAALPPPGAFVSLRLFLFFGTPFSCAFRVYCCFLCTTMIPPPPPHHPPVFCRDDTETLVNDDLVAAGIKEARHKLPEWRPPQRQQQQEPSPSSR